MTTLKDLRFGIELETVGANRTDLARAIHGVVGGTLGWSGTTVTAPDGREWRVVTDSSLGGDKNGEVVSPILTYADIEQLQEVVRAIHKAGARAHESAGIHIHVSSEELDAAALSRVLKMMNKQEALVHHALGVQERRLTAYCKPVDAGVLARIEASRPKTKEALKQAWYGRSHATADRYHSTRYSGINLNSWFFRGTVEYRLFESTTHAGEVKAYVQFALALTAKAMKSKAASSARREFNPATAKYDFRVFLLGLNLIGPEFKTARLHLMKRLAGSAAWKHGRPTTTAAAPAALSATA